MKPFAKTTLSTLCVLMFAALCAAQTSTGKLPLNSSTGERIPANSKVYIAPMSGFEAYLAAAFRKKNVPLIITTDRAQADYEITGSSEIKKAGWAKTIFFGDPRPSASASMQMVDLKTAQVVYADSSDRGSANRGHRSTAEKLAKYLKKKIEEDAKRAR